MQQSQFLYLKTVRIDGGKITQDTTELYVNAAYVVMIQRGKTISSVHLHDGSIFYVRTVDIPNHIEGSDHAVNRR